MNLNNLFLEFLTKNIGAQPDSKFLLAVSGGIDSMVMVSLFNEANLNIAVAHCNYSLRGNESDLDHQLVKTYCFQNTIPFYENIVDTKQLALKHKAGIQETARNIRYGWFEELYTELGFDYITTAHHKDDNAETILFNLIRGTGIRGLQGIPVQNNNIIRPLLFADREMILQYANEHSIPFRTDASNLENKYARNKIRNEIIPLFKNINTESVKHINELGSHSKVIAKIIDQHIDELCLKISHHSNEQTVLNCTSIINHTDAEFYLYELLKHYAFNSSQVHNILQSLLLDKTGNKFESSAYIAVINRGSVIIEPLNKIGLEFIEIHNLSNQEFMIQNQQFLIEFIPTNNISFFEKKHLYIDADLLSFPLTIRKWEHGDYFVPLGMNGRKKISDFLIDKKISIPDKEDIMVLVSGEKICAILNHQIDNSYKITSSTKNILHIFNTDSSKIN